MNHEFMEPCLGKNEIKWEVTIDPIHLERKKNVLLWRVHTWGCLEKLWRKMVTITLYVRQQKRHRCIEQSFGLCGRGRGWDDLREWRWNMYIIICEMNHQSRFDAWYRVLGASVLGWPRGLGWGGGSGWGTRVHPWRIHVNVWQKPLQYCKVISLQLE